MDSKAPEIRGHLGWLNTNKDLSLKDLRGKVVLLDFWTFCCINCMHVIPDLKKLEAKYPNELVVVGVHSAKFDNEKDTSNIAKAIMRYGIEHPVVNDANFAIWKAYGVRAWPTIAVIDPDGNLVTKISGEGNYQVLDDTIASLVDKFKLRGKSARKVPIALEADKTKDQVLSFPGKITADPKSARLFISDSGHNRILIVDRLGNILAKIGSGAVGKADGTYEKASFNHPQGLVYSGNKLYVADTENHLVRQIDLQERLVKTIAGNGKQGLSRGGKLRQTTLNSPWDLIFIGDKLYIAMAGDHQLWMLDLKQNLIMPYAGSGREDIVDGPLPFASLAQPSGITTDNEKLYFADSEVSAIRSAELRFGGKVSTIVGKGLFDFGDIDGAANQARLQHPLGIVVRGGTLYVADSYNHKVKTIDLATNHVKTLVGTGKSGLKDGADGQLSEPSGLVFLGDDLYIADTNNNAVRVYNLTTKELSTLKIK